MTQLTQTDLQSLPFLFEFWAMPHQLPPAGDWRTWVIMGGRGAGKTRAGAEWVRAQVEGAKPNSPGRAKRIAIVGETFDQARDVMVFGDSGILAVTPPDRRPVWNASRKQLLWPNGALAQVYSAHEPNSLRGPQFDALWADEFAKWRNGGDAWDMLQFALRLGENPQACVTTTPRNVVQLTDLLGRESTVMTHASTRANRANLAPGFMTEVEARYAGTRLGRQELDGLLVTEEECALWSSEMLAAAQLDKFPEMSRIVVAVDPPVTHGASSEDCGILVVGAVLTGEISEWRGYVLEDATVSAAKPTQWAAAAVAAMERHQADRIIAEVNQGGAMVEAIIRQIAPAAPYKSVFASRGKVLRAEPAAALYEQGRVHHVRGLGDLEDQMCKMTSAGFKGQGSPDRVDALVWALHELLIEPIRKASSPRMRSL